MYVFYHMTPYQNWFIGTILSLSKWYTLYWGYKWNIVVLLLPPPLSNPWQRCKVTVTRKWPSFKQEVKNQNNIVLSVLSLASSSLLPDWAIISFVFVPVKPLHNNYTFYFGIKWSWHARTWHARTAFIDKSKTRGVQKAPYKYNINIKM